MANDKKLDEIVIKERPLAEWEKWLKSELEDWFDRNPKTIQNNIVNHTMEAFLELIKKTESNAKDLREENERLESDLDEANTKANNLFIERNVLKSKLDEAVKGLEEIRSLPDSTEEDSYDSANDAYEHGISIPRGIARQTLTKIRGE